MDRLGASLSGKVAAGLPCAFGAGDFPSIGGDYSHEISRCRRWGRVRRAGRLGSISAVVKTTSGRLVPDTFTTSRRLAGKGLSHPGHK